MTEAELKAIEARCGNYAGRPDTCTYVQARAEFHAHFHTDIPALCAEVRLLQKRLADVRREPAIVHIRDEMVEQPSLLSTDVKDNK